MTSNTGEDYNKATLNDVNRQIGDTLDAAIGVADNAAAAATTTPAANNEAVAKELVANEPVESKIHRMNEKIKNFFKKIFKKDKPKVESTTATTVEGNSGSTNAAQ